jgi:hypothetical protein
LTDALSGDFNSFSGLVDERDLGAFLAKILPAADAMPPPPPVMIATLSSNLCLVMVTLSSVDCTQCLDGRGLLSSVDDSRTARNQFVDFAGR